MRIRQSWRCTVATLLVALSLRAAAQTKTSIKLDGTVGGIKGQVPQLLNSEYVIDASIGKLVNSNVLEHSFQTFTIGDTPVRFSPPDGVTAVLARVTGGKSTIDGSIRSSSAANIYLLNSAGIIFAKNANLDVQGSFIASTADSAHLADGTDFGSKQRKGTTLVIAPVGSFGFSGKAAPLTLDGAALRAKTGQSVSLIAGDITVEHSATIVSRPIVIRGKTLTVTSASLNSKATSSAPGGDIDIALTGNLNVTKNGQIEAGTSGDQPGGNIAISLPGQAFLSTGARVTSTNNTTGATGSAGNVSIRAGGLFIRSGAQVNASTKGGDLNVGTQANAGNVVISASALEMDGSDTKIDVTSGDTAFGDAGNVTLHLNSLEMSSRSSILAEAKGTGSAGEITIDGRSGRPAAKSVSMKSGSSLSVRSGTGATDPAGDIQINADEVTISGKTRSGVADVFTTIQSSNGLLNADQPVGGGNVIINAQTLDVSDGAHISVNTLGVAQGGSMQIRANDFNLTNGAVLSSASRPVAAVAGKTPGDAGQIDIGVNRIFNIQNASVTTEAPQANGGNIILNVGGLLQLTGGTITTDAGDNNTNAAILAGDISVSPGFVVLEDSAITANSSGPAGDILITTRGVIRTDDSRITAISSQTTLNGAVAVAGPETDLAGQLVPLPGELQSAAAKLYECCELKLTRNLSSFVEKGSGIPLEPSRPTPVLSISPTTQPQK